MLYSQVIHTLLENKPLAAEEMEHTFDALLQGRFSDVEIAGLLTAFNMKGVEPDELLGLARIVLKNSVPFSCQLPSDDSCELLDVCGTGGDHSGTFNVSTLAAVVCAAAGVPVVKHGNRAATSKCGSFDLLDAAGVLSLEFFDAARESERLRQLNIAFLFAPFFHPTLKAVAQVRKALGFPTVFNILGPLVNPARPRQQMIGIARPEIAAIMGPAARALGVRKAVFVHGAGELDEVSVTGPTQIFEYQPNARPVAKTISPRELGLESYSIKQLKGGSAHENLKIAEAVFRNAATGAQRDFVLANSGVALYAVGRAKSIRHGVELAREVLLSGKAGELWKSLKRR